MRVLIADDDYVCRSLLFHFLKPYGTCTQVSCGNEALTALRSAFTACRYFDLVLLDIMMPDIDGMDVLRNLRSLEERERLTQEQSARVLMTTGLDDPKNVMQAFRDSCDGYLVKPVNQNQLLKQLRDLSLIKGGA